MRVSGQPIHRKSRRPAQWAGLLLFTPRYSVFKPESSAFGLEATFCHAQDLVLDSPREDLSDVHLITMLAEAFCTGYRASLASSARLPIHGSIGFGPVVFLPFHAGLVGAGESPETSRSGPLNIGCRIASSLHCVLSTYPLLTRLATMPGFRLIPNYALCPVDHTGRLWLIGRRRPYREWTDREPCKRDEKPVS